jgi:hypothetical protein
MTRMTNGTGVAKQPWVVPTLTYQGSVGEVLQGGGGKLSITAADPGENRCEKPHADQCVPAPS